MKKSLILMLLLATAALATTHVVDLAGGGDFTSIHAAVNAGSVQDGDTVLVMSGTYLFSVADGVVTVDKELIILGSGYDLPANGGTTIDAAGQAFSFGAGSDASKLSGFRIIGNAQDMIYITGQEVVVENCYIMNRSNQVRTVFVGSTADTVRNCIFTNADNGSTPWAIGVQNSTDCVVNNNIFGSCYQGVATYSNTNLKIMNNIFLNSTNVGVYNGGAAWNYVDNATIYSNIFMNNATACSNAGSGTPTIGYNLFFENSTDGTTGTDAVFTNPLFVDYGSNDTYDFESYDDQSFDLQLQGGSPAVDAGHPLVDYFDTDGSRNDMGAYGGPWPIGDTGAPTIPVVNSISVTPTTVSPSGTITIEATGRIGD